MSQRVIVFWCSMHLAVLWATVMAQDSVPLGDCIKMGSTGLCPVGMACKNAKCYMNKGSICNPMASEADCGPNESCLYDSKVNSYQCFKNVVPEPDECDVADYSSCPSGQKCAFKNNHICPPGLNCVPPMVCVVDRDECGPSKGNCTSGQQCVGVSCNCQAGDDDCTPTQLICVDSKKSCSRDSCPSGQKCVPENRYCGQCGSSPPAACFYENKCVQDKDECGILKGACPKGKMCWPDKLQCDPQTDITCMPTLKCVTDRNECSLQPNDGYEACEQGSKCVTIRDMQDCNPSMGLQCSYSKCVEDKDECNYGNKRCKGDDQCVRKCLPVVTDEITQCHTVCSKKKDQCHPSNTTDCTGNTKCTMLLDTSDKCRRESSKGIPSPECRPYFQCMPDLDECSTPLQPTPFGECASDETCVLGQTLTPKHQYKAVCRKVPVQTCSSCVSVDATCREVEIEDPKAGVGYWFSVTACVTSDAADCESSDCSSGEVCTRYRVGPNAFKHVCVNMVWKQAD